MSGPVVFFLDRCIDTDPVAAALRGKGFGVERHRDWFPPACLDADWLPVVGRKCWVVLTKDRHILTRQPEIVAILRANTFVFVLRGSSKAMTSATVAGAYAGAANEILRIVRSRAKPLVGLISPSGRVTTTYDYAQLCEMLSNGSGGRGF